VTRSSQWHSCEDDGFTLIELMVTAALMSLCAIVVMTTVIGGVRTSARGEKRTDDAARAQSTLLQITADLRAAASFAEATPDKIVVYTRTTGASDSSPTAQPERVVYERTGSPRGSLTMSRQAGTLTAGVWAGTGTATTRTLSLGVLDKATAGRALFTYLSVLDSRRQCTTGPTTSSLGATVTGTGNLNRIYSVEVWLTVQSAPQLGGQPLVVPGGAVLANKGPLAPDPTLSTLGIGTGCS
jgi:prepilin-type N-terminal cleavage/methylation domain-containing protein